MANLIGRPSHSAYPQRSSSEDLEARICRINQARSAARANQQYGYPAIDPEWTVGLPEELAVLRPQPCSHSAPERRTVSLPQLAGSRAVRYGSGSVGNTYNDANTRYASMLYIQHAAVLGARKVPYTPSAGTCATAAADPQLQDAVGRRARKNLEQARNVLTGVRRCPRNNPHRDRRHAPRGSSKHTVASYMRCRDLGEANKSATALLALRDSQLEATRCPATDRQDWIFGRINSWAVRHHHSHI